MEKNTIKTTMEINLVPFYAEALAARTFLWKDIDRVYEQNKYVYYEYAKKSEFYDCGLAKEVSLKREEYFKKCIGIIEYIGAQDQEELNDILVELFKKGYKKVYAYTKDKREMDFNEFILYIKGMKKFFKSLSTDEFNGLFIAALFFSSKFESVVNGEELKAMLYERWMHSCGYQRFSSEKVNDGINKKINTYVKKIPSKIIQEKLYGTAFTKTSALAYLYDEENLSSVSLFEEIEFSNSDLRTIVYSYLVGQQNLPDDCQMEFDSYIIAGMHVMAMCRAYKKVKTEYFANNKETMYIELEKTEKELTLAKSELAEIKRSEKEALYAREKEIERLKQENEALKRELKRMEEWKAQREDAHVELEALRSFVFATENAETDLEEEENSLNQVDIENIDAQRGILIGGNPKWQQKMKEQLPHWSFKLPSQNLEEWVLRDAKILVFNTACLNHSMYYKAIRIARFYDIPVMYIQNSNVEKALQQMISIKKK